MQKKRGHGKAKRTKQKAEKGKREGKFDVGKKHKKRGRLGKKNDRRRL